MSEDKKKDWEVEHRGNLTVGELPLRLMLSASDLNWKVTAYVGNPPKLGEVISHGPASSFEEATARTLTEARAMVATLADDLVVVSQAASKDPQPIVDVDHAVDRMRRMDDEQFAEEIIFRLNNLIQNPDARDLVTKMIDQRIQAGGWVESHPTIQATESGRVGLMGIINGLVGRQESGWGYVAVQTDSDGTICQFQRCRKGSKNQR